MSWKTGNAALRGPVNGAEVLGKRSPWFTGLFLGEQLEGSLELPEVTKTWGLSQIKGMNGVKG